MILHPCYEPSRAEALAFLASRPLGRLVTVDPDGSPEVGLYPFWSEGDRVELHLVRNDPQARALKARPECGFEVDQELSFVPSHWEHPESAQGADHFYRFARCRGRASVLEDAAEVARHLGRLLSRYQPEGGHRAVTGDEPIYHRGLSRLVLVRIEVSSVIAKFKLGQNLPGTTRRRIARLLRARRGGHDLTTAALVERTLGPQRAS